MDIHIHIYIYIHTIYLYITCCEFWVPYPHGSLLVTVCRKEYRTWQRDCLATGASSRTLTTPVVLALSNVKRPRKSMTKTLGENRKCQILGGFKYI